MCSNIITHFQYLTTVVQILILHWTFWTPVFLLVWVYSTSPRLQYSSESKMVITSWNFETINPLFLIALKLSILHWQSNPYIWANKSLRPFLQKVVKILPREYQSPMKNIKKYLHLFSAQSWDKPCKTSFIQKFSLRTSTPNLQHQNILAHPKGTLTGFTT